MSEPTLDEIFTKLPRSEGMRELRRVIEAQQARLALVETLLAEMIENQTKQAVAEMVATPVERKRKK